MAKLQALFGVLLLIAVAASAEKDCIFGTLTIKQGEWQPAPIGECLRYTCHEDGSVSGLGCGVFQVQGNCHISDYDYTKPYPECCPKPICNERNEA